MNIPPLDLPILNDTTTIKYAKFRESTTLTRVLMILICITLVLTLSEMTSTYFIRTSMQAYHQAGEAEQTDLYAQLESVDKIATIISFSSIFFLIVQMIIALMWIYRANYNAHQMTDKKLQFTPGWSVGWYFIPFANLVKPYQSMTEIYQVSLAPDDFQTDKEIPTGITGWWWFLGIISTIVDRFAYKQMSNLEDGNSSLEAILRVNTIYQFSYVLGLIVTVIFLCLVNTIYTNQQAHYRVYQSVQKPS